jgi:Fe2+ transport system protein FeoA
MSCTLVASTSRAVPLSSLGVGERAVVCGAADASGGRLERLIALGITPGAVVTMLQRFPGVVFLCDQTELAVERGVADAISVKPMERAR